MTATRPEGGPPVAASRGAAREANLEEEKMMSTSAWATAIALCFVLTASTAHAQDVLYLKNGSVIRGTVMEMVPNKSVKIKTADGSIFVYEMDQVEKLTRDETAATAPPAAETTVADEPPPRLLTLDPLGLIQFGPVVGLEFRVSPTSYLTAHVRWATAGLVYYAIASDGFEDGVNPDNLAVGIGYRALLGEVGPHHWYVRPVVEYGWGTTSGEQEKYRSTYVTFVGNLGYRWRFARSVTNVGVYAGMARQLTNDWWYVDSPGEVMSDDRTTYPIGMVEVSFGWEF
jgi:hypothetical protein